MRKIFPSIVILFLFSIVSCSEQVKPEYYTYTKIFTGEHSKTWKLTSIKEWSNGTLTDGQEPSCYKDDRYTFYANSSHTLNVASGNNKCNTDSPEADDIESSWAFRNATSSLTMLIPAIYDSPIPYNVREIDQSSMVLEIFYNDDNTLSYRFNFDVTDEE